MRTYKETLQLLKRANDYVTQVGKQDNLNLVQPPVKPVQSTPQANTKAGKAILDTTSTAAANRLKKNPQKPFTPLV